MQEIEIQNRMKFGDDIFKFATDGTPEENSNNFITSGAIYLLLRDLQNLKGRNITHTPTSASEDLVTSGGIYTALSSKLSTTEATNQFNGIQTALSNKANVSAIDEINAQITALRNAINTLDPNALSGGTGSGIVGSGSFQQAYTYATQLDNPDDMFIWYLNETDDNNNVIKKIIYHTGNCQFIDALGGRVIGQLDGISIS